MNINTLYLPLKEVSGNTITHQTITFKTREYIRRYNHLPKKGWHGYYNKSVQNDAELEAHTLLLKALVEGTLERLVSKSPTITQQLNEEANPHWTTEAAQYKKLKCKLLCMITHLCRAKVTRSWKAIEDSLYHINTSWLAVNRLVHGEATQYRDHKNIAYEGNFIPLKERFYGKRKRTS